MFDDDDDDDHKALASEIKNKINAYYTSKLT